MSRKGIGRLLKDAMEKEETKVVSISKEIDKACESGMTEAGRFSCVDIKKKLREMISIMDSDDFNRDLLFSAFNELYSVVMAPDGRAKGVFHPSQLLDGCQRQMYFDLKGESPTDARAKVSAALQRTFDVGTWYHIYFQNILYKIGYLEQAEVPVVNKERFLNGKADGVFKDFVFGEKVVLEIKSMNTWNFSKAVFRPFKKHEFQASLYARELGAKKVLYLYVNKDTSEIRDFLMPVNEEQLALADKKMEKVIACVHAGEVPKRTCPDRYCENALRCPFTTLCFSKD